ncbi:MAG: LapA family protein [Burkholderiales bacterium]
MKSLVWLLRGLLFLLLLAFVMKNADPVIFRMYGTEGWEVPLAVAVLVAFVAGMAIGVVFCLPAQFRLRREILGLRKEIRTRPDHTQVEGTDHPRNGD